MNAELPLEDERPDPRFAEHLEWELRRALRREARFARPVASAAVGANEHAVTRPSRRALAPLAAVFAVALALGGGGAWAAQSALRSRGAQALVSQQHVLVQLALVQERRAREEFERAQREHAAGLAPSTRVIQARAELARAVERVALERIDAEELEATGRAPQRNLGAPRVGARDMVRERLEHERTSLVEQLNAAQELVQRADVLVASGVETSAKAQAAKLAADRLAERLALTRTRIQLRAEFATGRGDPARVELLDLEAHARARRELSRLELDAAQRTLGQTRALAQNGLASVHQLERAEIAIETHAAELHAAHLELEWLAEELAKLR